MYPSYSDANNTDPIASSIDHSFLHGHFVSNYIYPYPKEEDPLSFFNLCQLELEDDHDIFLLQHHDLLIQQETSSMMNDNSVSETIINMPDSCKNEESTVECTKKSHHNIATDHRQKPGKRSTSKKDRHSKINTAKGPRDRRMRLSLDVARDFFGLQDMLGYDKASRTVEWLLIQARPEIKKLGRKAQVSQMSHSCSVAAAKSPSSTSEGEVVSGVNKEENISKEKPSSAKEKKVRQPRKTSFRPLARDLREKARARAKERTKAKSMRFDKSQLCDGGTRNINDLNYKLSSWSSFETGAKEPDIIQDYHHGNNNPSLLAEVKEWNPNWMFNCIQNAGFNQEHQLKGFVPFGKPWEAYNYNNQNL